jgi:hypothetical protein
MKKLFTIPVLALVAVVLVCYMQPDSQAHAYNHALPMDER